MKVKYKCYGSVIIKNRSPEFFCKKGANRSAIICLGLMLHQEERVGLPHPVLFMFYTSTIPIDAGQGCMASNS